MKHLSVTLSVICSLALSLNSAEYFLAPDGSDSAAGSRAMPWKNLQSAVNRLQPGDMLTLLPGEYRQPTVNVTCIGTAERPVTIRGLQRDLAIITAWQDFPGLVWRPVAGKRFVYVADVPRKIAAVTEIGTMPLQPAPGVDDMENFRGTFFYDDAARKLYLHPVGGNAPDARKLKYTVNSGHLLTVNDAAYLTVRDLTFCGSAHENIRLSALGSALRAVNTVNFTIDSCNFFYNSGGVNITDKCRDVTVKNSRFYRNVSSGYGEMAQLFFGSSCRNSLAENNLITDGNTHGLRFYSNATDVTARNNRIVREHMGLYFKASAGKRLAEGNVVVDCTVFNYSDMDGGRPIRDTHNTFAMPSYIYDANATNLLIKPGVYPQFAAPEHYDFRLQGDSKCFGQGAFPDRAAILYVSPGGNDTAAGTSERAPLQTLKAAFARAAAGTTIYLAPGSYMESLELQLPSGVVLRGRTGNPSAVITALTLHHTANAVLENIVVGNLTLNKNQDCSLLRVMAGKLTVNDCERLKIRRGTFDSLTGKNWRGGELLFSVTTQPPALSDCPALLQGYNSSAPHPAPGAQATAAGALDPAPDVIVTPQLEKPVVEAVYPNMAAISWITPNLDCDQWRVRDDWWDAQPVMSILEYGETPDCRQKMPSTGNVFHRVQLFDLKPGTRYYCRVSVPDRIMALLYDGWLSRLAAPGIQQKYKGAYHGKIISFTTPETVRITPRTFYVAPHGANSNSGTAKSAPWQTLSFAGNAVRPGDTVILLPGVYRDTFRPLVSGLPDAPVTLRAESPGDAILDGSNFLRPAGVVLDRCRHMVIQGMTFQRFSNKNFASRAGMGYGQLQLAGCSDIVIKENLFSGYGTYQTALLLKNCNRIDIAGNIFAGAVTGISGGANGTLTIRDNTFYAPLIYNFMLHYGRTGLITVTRNLFVGQSRQKCLAGISRGDISGQNELLIDGNVWYFSPGDPKRFCGLENRTSAAPDTRFPAGLQRLRAIRQFEKNGREISELPFRSSLPVDPFDEKAYTRQIVAPVEKGLLQLTPAMFAPHKSISAGARP